MCVATQWSSSLAGAGAQLPGPSHPPPGHLACVLTVQPVRSTHRCAAIRPPLLLSPGPFSLQSPPPRQPPRRLPAIASPARLACASVQRINFGRPCASPSFPLLALFFLPTRPSQCSPLGPLSVQCVSCRKPVVNKITSDHQLIFFLVVSSSLHLRLVLYILAE